MRVMVLGLDGLTPSLVAQWLDDLPNMKHMMESGIWGELLTTIPPMSPAAWTTLTTGLLPEQHGVTGFLRRKRESYERTLCRAPREDRLWDVLGRSGMKSIVVNVPLTFPPDSIQGVIASGLLTPSEDSDFVKPSHMKQIFLNHKYTISSDFESADMNDYLRVALARVSATQELMETNEWDLCWLVIMETDHLQHFNFHNMSLIKQFYIEMDRIVGEINSTLSKDDYFMVLSDHGFVSVKHHFSLLNWLESEGYLFLKRGGPRNYDGIDWHRTIAYPSEYGSIFIHDRDAYPTGIVDSTKVDSLCAEILQKLGRVHMNTAELIIDGKRKSDLYSKDGAYYYAMPDLIPIYNTKFRIADPAMERQSKSGEIFITGSESKWSGEHCATYMPSEIAGTLLAQGPKMKGRGEVFAHVRDITPTILSLFDIKQNERLRGTPIYDQ